MGYLGLDLMNAGQIQLHMASGWFVRSSDMLMREGDVGQECLGYLPGGVLEELGIFTRPTSSIWATR